MVTKSKPKHNKLVPVAVEDVRIGQTISLHGKILSAKEITGRNLYSRWVKKGKGKVRAFKYGDTKPTGYELHTEGKKGILFTTTTGEYFYLYGATVWTVR